MKKRIGLGYFDFKEFIDENLYFVDKTPLIGYLIDQGSKVNLITRPRRFGKSLNISMLGYFFETDKPGKVDPEGHRTLFDEFKICSHPRFEEFQGHCPVINLSFKEAKDPDFETSLEFLQDAIAGEYRRHKYLTELLDKEEKLYFESILHGRGNRKEYSSAIKELSRWLEMAYKQKVIILLDEYDTPLQAAYQHGCYKEMIPFIRSFMLQTFKDNPALKQAVLIGILRVAQESIFSDFNNPSAATILDMSMDEYFGFTEEEVVEAACYFDLEDKLPGIREWYNGYIFGQNRVIYNPWSIMSYLREPRNGLIPYWVNTSNNLLIKEVLQLDKLEGKKGVETLLKGEPFRKNVMNHVVYTDIKKSPEAAWSFLLHAGYLKASEREQDGTRITYNLSIPNLEVAYVYQTMVQNWFRDNMDVDTLLQSFIEGIQTHNTGKIEETLESILLRNVSYYDAAISEESEKGGERTKRENFYHGLVLGLLLHLGSAYSVESNSEHGLGRPDIVIIKKTDPVEAVIIELKQAPKSAPDTPETLAEAALNQIESQKYDKGIKEKWQPQTLFCLGVGFKGKELKVSAKDHAPPSPFA